MLLKTQFISQIYWPDFLINQKEKGFLIGWNMENFQCCITNFVIISDNSFLNLQQTLNKIGEEDHFYSCSKTESKPIILGEWVPVLPDDYTPQLAYQREGIWLTLTRRSSGPLLHSLYSCGCLHRTSCHMIRYEAVQARQLHSFSVSDCEGRSALAPYNDGMGTISESDLSYAIYQINNAENLGGFIWENFSSDQANDMGKVSNTMLKSDDTSDDNYTETDLLLQSDIIENESYSPPVLGSCTTLMLYCTYLWLSSLNLLQTLLETRISSMLVSLCTRFIPCLSPQFMLTAPRFIRSVSLKDISITCAYICERSRLLWHCLYTSIDFTCKSSVSEVKSRRKQWIFVYSRLIFICIDILLGITFGLYLWYNRRELLKFFHSIGEYVQTQYLLGNLEYLSNSPHGIKFNHLLTERLSSTLAKSIIALSSGYDYFIRESFEEYLIYAICFMGCFGFSFQMLLVVDIIRSLTVHISIIHMALSLLHYFQVKSLSTLFYLFQGKKKNYLRNRIDTLETNRSQLFFGTVYFTVLCFLFPTFAAYFFLFTMLQFCVVTLQAILWCFSIIVKEFPWCEVYLYVQNPHVLSHGVHIDIDYIRSSQKPRDVASQSTEKLNERRRIKKDLLRETLRKQKNNMANLELTGKEHVVPPKVKFNDDIQTVSHYSYKDDEPDIRGCDNLSPELQDVEKKADDSNEYQRFVDAGLVQQNTEQGSELMTSILESDSDTSSNSSEDIGWARGQSEEDQDIIYSGSIFAMENVWGSSDDVDHSMLTENRELHSPIDHASLTIAVDGSNSLPPDDLSPRVHRYSPTKKNYTPNFSPVSSCTTYLSIRPSSQPLFHHLSRPYIPYITYWFKRETILRVLRGLIKGKPAIDLQIIRAAVEISSSSLRKEDRNEPNDEPSRNGIANKIASPPPSSRPGSFRLNSSSETNAVSRSPNLFDLWSLLMRTCNHVYSDDQESGESLASSKNGIFIYGVQSTRNSHKRKLEKFLFFFLIFTISLCLLAALLGLCYACSPSIIGVLSSIFRFIITAIKRSKVTRVPQRGIFDIGKVHSFFNHHHSA